MNQNENTHVQHARNQFISYYSETTSNGKCRGGGGGLRGLQERTIALVTGGDASET